MIAVNLNWAHSTTCSVILKCPSLTPCVVLLLLMQGSMSTVLALVLAALVSGVLCDGLLDRLSVLGSCCLEVSSTETEHCRRFFLRWCGRLLRHVGGFRRSGTKALGTFLWPGWPGATGYPPPELALTDEHVLALSPSSSDSETINLVRRIVGVRLLERCRGFGSQKSEEWRLARRLCCGLLNTIQYGGQDGPNVDDDSWGWCWMMKRLCSPVSTQFSSLNSYCHMDEQIVSVLPSQLRSFVFYLVLCNFFNT